MKKTETTTRNGAPEDTLAETLSQTATDGLRAVTPGAPPESTRSELLDEAAKGNGKNSDISDSAAMTPEEAKIRAARDIEDHTATSALGPQWEENASSLRGQMAERASQNASYKEALDALNPELAKQVAAHNGNTPKNDAAETVRLEEEKAAEDELRRKMQAEQLQSGNNTVGTDKQGIELENGDFIMPRRIANNYTEVEGKFVPKGAQHVAFEDKGDQLATSGSNKETIADMVALAQAKNWQSLKLAGSQEFRREAWLQAESQGIKTSGYTPRAEDMAILESLRQDRATNIIKEADVKAKEAGKGQDESADKNRAPSADKLAPRNANRDPAVLDAAAKSALPTNMEALRNIADLSGRSAQDMEKLAYWRGLVAADNQHLPAGVQAEAVARFDQSAKDPNFVKTLPSMTEGKISDRTTERVQERETSEQSL